MPYLKEVVVTGKVVEVRKKYSARYGKKIPRSKNQNITPEAVERNNEREAERKLRWLINANFKEGDYHAIFEYRSDYSPAPEEARKHTEKLLRDMRTLYRKNGMTFRYILATERGKRGQKKIHHHLVINYLDTRRISSIWPWSRVKFFPLDNTGQYAELASYLIKRTRVTYKTGEAGYKKRWCQSKNLVIPVPKNYVISAKQWKEEPKPIKGYYIEKKRIFNGISVVTGYPMQFYSMVQISIAQHMRT